METSLESDEDEEMGTYQKKLRERANRSIQQLSNMLVNQSCDNEALDQSSSQHSSSESSRQQTQQSEAVSQLRSLLQKQAKELGSPSPSKRKPVPKKQEDGDSLPEVQDLVPIIHNQSEYIQHLEAEVKFCKEELLAMKQRVRVVIVENEKLQEELKAKMLEDTLKEYTLLDGTVHAENSLDKISSTPAAKPRRDFIQKTDDKKWEKELEQLKCLYQAQSETLEAQVVSLKKELMSAQTECEDLKERLRHKEAMTGVPGAGQRVGGLCLKCAQHEAVLAETHSNIHIQAIERLTKERDELMTALCSLRASQSEAQQREWAAYHQVKQAVEMAEEANLEKTKAQVQCEHVLAELARQRERLEKELALEQEKIAQARDAARSESKREKEELAQMVTSLTCRVAEQEGLLDRGDRERNSLNTQLEEAFKKLTAQETDNSRTCGELRYQLSQAQLKREEAERELRDSRSNLGRQLELTQQEVQKLVAELSGSQQRLEEAQRAEGRARTEAAGLAEGLNRAQRQLHLTRKEKEALERHCVEDMAALTFQAQQREHELTQTLQQMEAQHEKNVADMDVLLSLQNGLIGKLKEECRTLCSRMEELAQSNRLQQLDQHCQSSAQQVMELLSRQNQLVHERQFVTEEMHRLHVQFPAERSETA
ncbi:serologically defined colon cancer antigen 8 homolog isoform X2 [Tachysurus fulvidraco]|uniref:serologically defined colon cancer antigen 8 homolog isoform X2 n=1 Tax=Tachysurus fulvidraco TaxID=1234273 RepID=UPI001FEF78FF|nr:serologically defined colon cancer antigen 8 homolog isoform X2 [Tachysurus fulvidraco]